MTWKRASQYLKCWFICWYLTQQNLSLALSKSRNKRKLCLKTNKDNSMLTEMTCCKEFLKDPRKQESQKVIQGEGEGKLGSQYLWMDLHYSEFQSWVLQIYPLLVLTNHCKENLCHWADPHDLKAQHQMQFDSLSRSRRGQFGGLFTPEYGGPLCLDVCIMCFLDALSDLAWCL